MTTVLVANPKGGVGKTTLSTNIASYWASRGRQVMLGDLDKQESSALWLSLRPATAAPIQAWRRSSDGKVLRPPPGTTHAVLDSPAGLHGKRLREVLEQVQKVVVPIQPSIFDIYATRDFLHELVGELGKRKAIVRLVGMRVDSRTVAAERLQEFIAMLDLNWVTNLRDTQLYVQLAAQGLGLFDVQGERYERDRAQWAPLAAWLDA
ncbi:cobyrinic acid a,c-diamide synthase [Comamonas serinivorans]|uniref:Cobyrinic acid a,c-diamide synthase n=1 Tax=Comamonas serinivorans TaxID=1082851 RepID=A0A1Y0EJE1_9BURK|nr:ParA family protein [Comamonas serinivorans]ARU03392.1 cobyrinic acid a,c-diamide synthase [Comamonas serinivorans]